MKKEFKKLLDDNDIVQGAFRGELPDAELMAFLGSDILMLSYIKLDLANGHPIEKVAKFYGVTVEGIEKFVLKSKSKNKV